MGRSLSHVAVFCFISAMVIPYVADGTDGARSIFAAAILIAIFYNVLEVRRKLDALHDRLDQLTDTTPAGADQ